LRRLHAGLGRYELRFLFDGMDGNAVRRIEAKVREMPRLEWFDLFTKFVRENDLRKAPADWFAKHEDRVMHAESA